MRATLHCLSAQIGPLRLLGVNQYINKALSFFEKTLTIVYSWALLLFGHATCLMETTMNPLQFDAGDSVHHAEIQAQLCAYNAAFDELGLRFRWDAQTLALLAMIEGEQAQIAAYIEAHHAHLLNAYSAEFLSQAILEKKRARYPAPLPRRVESAPRQSRVVHQPEMSSWRERVSYEVDLPALAGV
ncbi:MULTISPECIES: hypothetical protein [Paraburkholderia]